MKINCIFADVLHSFVNEKGICEWNDAVYRLTNLEYLEDFFEFHKSDLMHGYYRGRISNVTDAALETRKLAQMFFSTILKNCKSGESLDSVFKSLDNRDSSLPILQSVKAKNERVGYDWLRMYGLRVESNCYVITGGTIKLTLEMKDRIHTAEEYSKLNRYSAYLKKEDIFDKDSLYDFIENI